MNNPCNMTNGQAILIAVARPRTTRIHVIQQRIRGNKIHGTTHPPIGVMQGKTKRYGNSVDILGDSKLVYSPDKPLACGARLWIETQAEVRVHV